jgi:UV DNA damage endonuclease
MPRTIKSTNEPVSVKDRSSAPSPHLGLVCMTAGPEIRFRTITRTRYLALSKREQRAALEDIYAANVATVSAALSYCWKNDIRLYRVISSLFPMSDESLGQEILREMAAELAKIGEKATRLNVRVIAHPDQFVVLSSEKPVVVEQSISILHKHALAFNAFGLEQSPWNCLIIHGGKGGRAAELIDVIKKLPPTIRHRLVLENDERAYSSAEILDVCRKANVPMIFDHHHHAVHEKLTGYDDPSVAAMLEAAATTWTPREWQVVHLSNGIDGVNDQRHTDLISDFPAALYAAPWIEVEAKGKEVALFALRQLLAKQHDPPE